jgi:hypothetical protein
MNVFSTVVPNHSFYAQRTGQLKPATGNQLREAVTHLRVQHREWRAEKF